MNTTGKWARHRLMLSIAGGVLGVTLVAAAGAAAAFTESARDEFSTISYGGSNGTLDWTSSWIEVRESDGPSAGVVDVAPSNRCVANNCLRIGGDAADVDGRGVWREVNLEDASSAVLTFSFRRNRTGMTGTGAVSVAVSSNGGGSWITLGTCDFPGPEALTDQNFDITAYASSETRIRFLATGTNVAGYLHFDNIDIVAVFPDAPSPPPDPTTTTVPEPTTTTTMPTTTTVPRSTTTTTVPRSTTTTTVPRSTTTTMPSPTSSASIPPPGSGSSGSDPRHLTPITGLTVAFSTTVEALGESALSVIALGALVAWLSILGIDRRGANRPASERF